MRRFSQRSLQRALAVFGIAAFFAVLIPTRAQAQWPAAQQPAPQTTAPAPLLSPDQLDDLVAPIALYPDPLLSQVLVASTYPLELVEAEQWVKANPSLQGQQLTDAAKQQDWDPSVQAMVAFPNVMGQLTQDVRWTTDLGNAFLAQQADVMAAVQRMRARAQANGRLVSTPQETVTTAVDNGQTAIEIVPTDPEVIYVPMYDPAYIWGPPVWGYYPSLWYPSYGFGWWPGINIGFCFGSWGGWGGWGGWGWGAGWFNRSVFVNAGFFNHYGFHGFHDGDRWGGWGRSFGGGRYAWSHDPNHRLGISYPNRQLQGRYGATSMASRASMTRGGFGAIGSRSSFGMRNSFGGRNAFGQSYGGRGARDSFGQAYGGRGRDSFGQSYGNRGSYGTPGGARSFQGSQGFRGGAQPGVSRGYQGPGARGNAQSFRGAPAPNNGGGYRSFSGGARTFRGSAPAPSFRGGNGGGFRGFSSPAPSYRAPAPSFRGGNFGGGGRSFSAPRNSGGGGGFSAPRSFGGGGGARSFGGGGGRSFGGGGGSARSSGGGGGRSFGGGGHGGRR